MSFDAFNFAILNAEGDRDRLCLDCWFFGSSIQTFADAGDIYFQVIDTDNVPDGASLDNYSFDIDVVSVFTEQLFLDGSLGMGEFILFTINLLGSGLQDLLINTEGSDFDTEIALFDSSGLLLAQNDDVGSQNQLWSQVSLANLPSGTYSLALGGFNSAFNDGPSLEAIFGFSSGEFQLNIFSDDDFGVVNAPATLTLLSIGLIGLNCRRTEKKISASS
ncbi:MAG: DVUA0089 family protein [Pseudomonadota bacterium]